MPGKDTIQSAEIALPESSPASYETLDELTESLSRKGTPQPGSGLYPRDGEDIVTKIEEKISEITIPGQRLNVVVSSGMAAVSQAVSFAMSKRGSGDDCSPLLAHGTELYSQSTNYFSHLKNMGVSVRSFDSGSDAGIDKIIETVSPDVIFAETVANTPNMPVLNIRRLLHKIRGLENPPLVVLDNTLPLSSGVNFAEFLAADEEVLVVESGTKNAMNNSRALGVIYSKNEKLIDEFRKFKATTGIVTGSNEEILEDLNATIPGFHDRNRAVFSSTGKLAIALAKAEEVLGEASDFTSTFPSFPGHPNHEYVKENMIEEGISPVAFIVAKIWDEGTAKKLLDRISQHPRIREQVKEGQIFFGQSFGMSKARMLYDVNAPNVRFSGGFDVDDESLADSLLEAAADK